MTADLDREARLRQMAARQGLILGKSRRQSPAVEQSEYMLFADPDRASAVLPDGEKRSPLEIGDAGYAGTLDAIETFLLLGEQEAIRSAAPPDEAGSS
jgi:hypothetical protein